jgi:2-(1,2-epoxy-1,2-dihydrophenyl)acetyl-CoA isomerase
MASLPWYVDSGPIRRWLRAMDAAGESAAAWKKIDAWKAMVDETGVVTTRKQGKIGIVELNYPKKGNALVPPLYGLFTAAMEKMAEDEDVWVIVLTGTGKNFCSGGYVGHDAFYSGLDSGANASAAEPMRRTFAELFQSIQRSVYQSEKPVIAMLNGLTAGEAVDLILCADIRTGHAESDIWFSYGYTGNTAYAGAAWLLPRLVGLSEASRILLTAERVPGARAHEIGLITTLSSREKLRDDTMALAERIAALPPITLRLIKKEIHRGLEIGSFLSNLDVTSMIEPIVQFTQDHMDAENAILEKRKPVVKGY